MYIEIVLVNLLTSTHPLETDRRAECTNGIMEARAGLSSRAVSSESSMASPSEKEVQHEGDVVLVASL